MCLVTEIQFLLSFKDDHGFMSVNVLHIYLYTVRALKTLYTEFLHYIITK